MTGPKPRTFTTAKEIWTYLVDKEIYHIKVYIRDVLWILKEDLKTPNPEKDFPKIREDYDSLSCGDQIIEGHKLLDFSDKIVKIVLNKIRDARA